MIIHRWGEKRYLKYEPHLDLVTDFCLDNKRATQASLIIATVNFNNGQKRLQIFIFYTWVQKLHINYHRLDPILLYHSGEVATLKGVIWLARVALWSISLPSSWKASQEWFQLVDSIMGLQWLLNSLSAEGIFFSLNLALTFSFHGKLSATFWTSI